MQYLTIIIILSVTAVGIWWFKRRKTSIVITDEFKSLFDILENSNQSVFITGKAGTGKSTFLTWFRNNTKKNYVVLAPTGIAAMNVAGQTIHSFFRLPPRPVNKKNLKPDYARNETFMNLELLIIDEVSMVRSDLMDGIDHLLRLNRNQPSQPFGGVQVALIGDLFQLPPVVTSNIKDYILERFGGEYFFNAPVFMSSFQYIFFELTRIFRQKDEAFIRVLNNVRVNKTGFEEFVTLNSKYKDNVELPGKGQIFLTTTNKNADKINKQELEKLDGKTYVYKAMLEGTLKSKFDQLEKKWRHKEINNVEFLTRIEKVFPTQVILKLKVGAQIMMLKNDSTNRWVNGSVGTIKKLERDKIIVEIDNRICRVEREEWEEIDYKYDSRKKELTHTTKGKFSQFPLKLAWAITIHKSQGKTFDNIILDLGSGAFVYGQTYVALSRCRTLEGIVLNRQIQPTDIFADPKIVSYYNMQRRQKFMGQTA